MLFTYRIDNGNLRENTLEDLSPASVWIDLLHPALGEEKRVEEALGIGIPTREEMREIEPSSRLYVEHEARYMTASLLCRADLDMPQLAAVTFILTKGGSSPCVTRRRAASTCSRSMPSAATASAIPARA